MLCPAGCWAAQEAEKRGDFLENKVPAGVVEAYEFHARLQQVGALGAGGGWLGKWGCASGKWLVGRRAGRGSAALCWTGSCLHSSGNQLL